MHSASAVHNSAWNVVYGHVVLCHGDAASEMSKKLYSDLCSQVPKTSLLPCLGTWDMSSLHLDSTFEEMTAVCLHFCKWQLFIYILRIATVSLHFLKMTTVCSYFLKEL